MAGARAHFSLVAVVGQMRMGKAMMGVMRPERRCVRLRAHDIIAPNGMASHASPALDVIGGSANMRTRVCVRVFAKDAARVEPAHDRNVLAPKLLTNSEDEAN